MGRNPNHPSSLPHAVPDLSWNNGLDCDLRGSTGTTVLLTTRGKIYTPYGNDGSARVLIAPPELQQRKRTLTPVFWGH